MKNVKIFAKTIEQEAKEQIERMAASEAYRDCQIRIMPDCHAGKGCTIGTVIQTAGKVVPNTVGVDIGCGMLVVNLGKKEVNLSLLDRIINESVPSGFDIHEKSQLKKMSSMMLPYFTSCTKGHKAASTTTISNVRLVLSVAATTLSNLTRTSRAASILWYIRAAAISA